MRSIKFYTRIASHTIPHSQSHRTHRPSHTPRHRSHTPPAPQRPIRARATPSRHAVAPVAPVAHTVPVDPSRAPCARAGRWRSPSRANVEARCAASTLRFSRHLAARGLQRHSSPHVSSWRGDYTASGSRYAHRVVQCVARDRGSERGARRARQTREGDFKPWQRDSRIGRA
jgi:hypothetical protein